MCNSKFSVVFVFDLEFDIDLPIENTCKYITGKYAVKVCIVSFLY